MFSLEAFFICSTKSSFLPSLNIIFVKTKVFSNTISVIAFIKIVVFNLQSKTKGENRGNLKDFV